MKRSSTPAVVLALVFLAASSALAMRLSITLSQVAERADLAFVGTVVQAEPTYNDAGFIVTDYAFSVEQALKGVKPLADPATVTLRFAGGQIGDVGMRVSGVPELQTGSRYVLLAYSGNTSPASPIVGVDQGLFRVVTEPATGRELVLTASGRFVERIEDGDVVVGSVAALTPEGRYLSREQVESRAASASDASPMPKATGSDGATVVCVRRLQLPVTDAGKVMTLRSFLASLEPLLAASASE